jgi:hypothetical protein
MGRPLSSLPGKSIFLILVLTALAGVAAISNQSLWIDEANTVDKASAPNPAAWSRRMLGDTSSDCQMPLYMAWMFSWQKIVPVHPEWMLRLSNLPWLMLAQAALLFGLRSGEKSRDRVHERRKGRFSRFAVALALLAGCHPFLWYYMNEARPYILQFCGTALLASIVCHIFSNRENNVKLDAGGCLAWGAGTLILSGSSMLGVVWAGTLTGAIFWLCRRFRIPITKRGAWILGAACVTLILLGGYYLHTLLVQHAGPTPGQTGVANLLFALYELLGFTGLGPGRTAMRTGHIGPFIPWLPLLTAYGLVVSLFLVSGFRAAWRKLGPATLLVFGAAILFPALMTLVCGAASHARVLGRHLMPACLPVLFLLAAGMTAMKGRKRLLNGLLVAMLAASALSVRFAERHAKDDFRHAAAVAKGALAQSQSVWWAGDQCVALYYSLPLNTPPGEKPAAEWVNCPQAGTLAGMPKPDLVVLTRPDVYDRFNAVADFLDLNRYRKNYQSHAVTIWQKPGQ